MPRMTGLEFVAALRADTTIPRMPVLLLTSTDEDADYKQLGVVENLVKPLRADVLLAAVYKHLPPRAALLNDLAARLPNLEGWEPCV
jgi:CheY-like chemotaxis protein